MTQRNSKGVIRTDFGARIRCQVYELESEVILGLRRLAERAWNYDLLTKHNAADFAVSMDLSDWLGENASRVASVPAWMPASLGGKDRRG